MWNIFILRKKKAIKVTKIGAVFAIKVAWATDVKLIDQFQTAISVPKKTPAKNKKTKLSLVK